MENCVVNNIVYVSFVCRILSQNALEEVKTSAKNLMDVDKHNKGE